jgi:hypothetical protein
MPVSVKGVIELRKALRAFSPDLAKGLTKEMGAALKPVVRQAKGFLPSDSQVLSNWAGEASRAQGKFPQYNQATARKGITYKTSPSKRNHKGFKSLATIFNKSAAGAIYETAGRKNGDSIFVRNLDGKYPARLEGKDKMRGRVIYRAWEHNQGKATAAVMRAVEKAAATFKARSTVK